MCFNVLSSVSLHNYMLILYLHFVLKLCLFACIDFLPNKLISYHIISYHIISYHIISYHIISYHILFLNRQRPHLPQDLATICILWGWVEQWGLSMADYRTYQFKYLKINHYPKFGSLGHTCYYFITEHTFLVWSIVKRNGSKIYFW